MAQLKKLFLSNLIPEVTFGKGSHPKKTFNLQQTPGNQPRGLERPRSISKTSILFKLVLIFYDQLLKCHELAFYKALSRHGCVRCKKLSSLCGGNKLSICPHQTIQIESTQDYLVFHTNIKHHQKRKITSYGFFFNINFSHCLYFSFNC